MNKNNATKSFLLSKAKEEFLRAGYSKVSMRDISNASGLALGNIYYYYKSKDKLFTDILKPVICRLEFLIQEHNKPQRIQKEIFDKECDTDRFTTQCTNFIEENRDDLYLLFFCSQGSSLENYHEKLIDQLTYMGMEYLVKFKMLYPNINLDIEPFLLHIYSSLVVTIMKDIVKKKKIVPPDLRNFFREYILFSRSGWKAVLRV